MSTTCSGPNSTSSTLTYVLFILDEIDSIGTDDDILYELPRCNASGNVDDTFVGVIGISNNFQFRNNLSARVKDSLMKKSTSHRTTLNSSAIF